MTKDETLKMALEALEEACEIIGAAWVWRDEKGRPAITAIKEALAQPEQEPVSMRLPKAGDKVICLEDDSLATVVSLTAGGSPDIVFSDGSRGTYLLREFAELFGYVAPPQPEQEPVAWISVKDNLPKAVRGVSYKQSLTDVVLVRHSDRPDYPITAHAVVGEGLGAGVAIPTDGASEHPEIAWYSASSNLNNPFDLKNDDYERYLPKVFGSKITHWKPIDTSPPPQRKPLTDEQREEIAKGWRGRNWTVGDIIDAIEAAHGIGEQK